MKRVIANFKEDVPLPETVSDGVTHILLWNLMQAPSIEEKSLDASNGGPNIIENDPFQFPPSKKFFVAEVPGESADDILAMLRNNPKVEFAYFEPEVTPPPVV